MVGADDNPLSPTRSIPQRKKAMEKGEKKKKKKADDEKHHTHAEGGRTTDILDVASIATSNAANFGVHYGHWYSMLRQEQ